MDDAVVAFDTLKTVVSFQESGIEERQAKAIATTMRNAVMGGTAMKVDLTEFGGEI